MSTRRSGRATKAVKYTSASEGSDFEDKKKKPRKPSTTKKTPKPTATPKKAHKRAAESDNDDDDDDNNPTNNDNTTAPTTTPPKPKRQKKDPSTLAAEAQEKQTKADKAAHKKAWQDWLASHDASGEQLEVEPDKEESITQTDALKKYGLKKDELSSLLRFEKKNPLYGGTMKLFLEEDVRELGFRKLGMLEGCAGDDEEVVKRGEEIWEEGREKDVESTKSQTKNETTPSSHKEAKPEKQKKEKTPKQKWSAYISAHALSSHNENDDDNDNENLAQEPSDVINQTESKNKYALTPQDLACLPYFPKKNPVYGKTMKLFEESAVKRLAYRKAAVLAGVEGDDEEDEEAFLERGRVIYEKRGEGGEEEEDEE